MAVGRRALTLPLQILSIVAVLGEILGTVISIMLWLVSGYGIYRETIVDFDLTHSTFDLACIAAAKSLIVTPCLVLVQCFSHQSISEKKHSKRERVYTLIVLCSVFVSTAGIIALVYAIVKGSYIIYELANGTWYEGAVHYELRTRVSDWVLCIFSVVFSALEIAAGVGCGVLLVWARLRYHAPKKKTEGEEEWTGALTLKNISNISRLAKLVTPEIPLLFFGLLMLLAGAGSSSGFPWLVGIIVDYSAPNQTNCTKRFDVDPRTAVCVPYTISRMNHAILGLLGLITVSMLTNAVRDTCFSIGGERFLARLKSNLFIAITRQEIGFFDISRTGELINRITADTGMIQVAITQGFFNMIQSVASMLISLALMLSINAELTGVLLSALPIVAVFALIYGYFSKKLRKDFQDILAESNNHAEETITNIRTVRAFSNEDKMNSKFAASVDKTYIIGRNLGVFSGIFSTILNFLMYGAVCLMLWYGGTLVFKGKLQSGTLVSIMLYALSVAMGFATLAGIYGQFMQAAGASVRIFEILDRIPKVLNGHLRLDKLNGAINFVDKVEFTYPARPDDKILKGLTFAVKPGTVVAMVGPSGGGKSTVVSLIERFYDVDKGEIQLDGHNVTMLDVNHFRKRIGLVRQEPSLFATSIADNIAFGVDNATIEEIMDAAKEANAHEFIMGFEDAYKTMVGEKGVKMSGGQKQRIAIARALLLNPDILLLDEATSALDAESEHLVQEAIDRAMVGRTVLIIAHRLSTVKKASKVFVLNQGMVVEEGTHDELLAMNGMYKQLVVRQLETK